jgi:hypothetical protein
MVPMAPMAPMAPMGPRSCALVSGPSSGDSSTIAA